MKSERRGGQSPDPLREATMAAIERVIDPLIGLMIDTGVTVPELNRLIRDRAVAVAAIRVSKQIGRISNSRISITTGLPRSEVARILKPLVSRDNSNRDQHAARRVLSAWYKTPAFLTTSGEPTVLPIFGRRYSFESLVARHGGGIPVRAMLDELTQMGAVEQLADQQVRAKSRVPISRGLTAVAISSMGERTRDLLDTLTRNLRHVTQPFFEATAISSDIDPEMLAVIRREIAGQGTNFISGIDSLLARSRARGVRGEKAALIDRKNYRLGVTAYYFQDQLDANDTIPTPPVVHPRRNLRRSHQTPK